MKQLHAYYGGKGKWADKIIPYLPPHKIYVEPFAGSGAVMFAKGLPNMINSSEYREVLNDKNSALISFFRVMQDEQQRKALIDRLEWTLCSQDEYQRAKDIYGNQDSHTIDDVAWAWFYLAQNSFASKIEGGFGMSRVSNNGAYSHFNAVKNLKSIRDRLRYCYFTNEDYTKCLERWDSPETLYYVDPPYPDTEQGHYRGFTQDDFAQLVHALSELSGMVALSCYQNDAVPNDWAYHTFDTIAYSTGITRNSKTKKRGEAKRTEYLYIKPHDRHTPQQLDLFGGLSA